MFRSFPAQSVSIRSTAVVAVVASGLLTVISGQWLAFGAEPDLLRAPFDRMRALAAQKTWANYLKHQDLEITNSIGMKLILIPTGEFGMGCPEQEVDRIVSDRNIVAYKAEKEEFANQYPLHTVRITKPFYMGKCEVTQEEYEVVVGRNPSLFSARNGRMLSGWNTKRFPVDSVAWYDAVEFCNKLSVKEHRQPYYRLTDTKRNQRQRINSAVVTINGGNGYRLPTEAEWEFACRAGTTTPFHFGATLNGKEANCNGNSAFGTPNKGPNLDRTTTVASYVANSFGLFDMHGNVAEWCWDIKEPMIDNSKVTREKSLDIDPIGPSKDFERTIKGGSWLDPAFACRSANRAHEGPAFRYFALVGFRVVCEP